MIDADHRLLQYGVGFFLVKCPMRHIGDRETLDRLATFELQVAFAVGLVRRLLRRMRLCRKRRQAKIYDKASNKTHQKSDAFHACFPLFPLSSEPSVGWARR